MSDTMKKKFPSLVSLESDGNTSFLRAARAGHLDKVLEHLKSNIDINTSNTNGLNALHLASKDGHVEVVAELLKRGAVVDAATKKGNTALHIASLAGQEEVVKLLVQHGASVNVQSQNGFTPLYMAAQENHDNVVKYLLANGANQSLATEDGFTPVAVAMQQGHDKVVAVLLENDSRGKVRLPALHIAAKKDDVKAAKLLLDNEHNPDVTSKSAFTPLHIASHYGNEAVANLLIQKGADVNYAAKHNITPLHVAAKWGKSKMVSLLLDKGANIESKTRDGLTPLHCAARSGHEQVVEMLLERGAPISCKTKNGLAPLHMAAQGDHVDAARKLLNHRAPVDEVTVDYLTALHVAAHCGHVRVAKLLLDRGADANARALNGFTPLHIACKKNRIKVVELLLKHGASISATTESGLTPLHVASFMGCMNIVIYLLQHDANPDIPTVRGETPLHLAARANQSDIIRILLRNGAQVDARAREQQTPLHIASRLGNVDIVMMLLQHGAKVDTTTKDMYTALHIAAKEGQDEVAAALIDNGAALNATSKKGFTPLHLAAKYGNIKVAKLLLQKEAPVDAQGKNGVTPLHVASHYDHQNVALLLLDKGASPHATAKNGHTPLHIAARKNQMDIANTLLEYGAQPNVESKAGFTPLHLSSQEGHADMSALLIEHQANPNHPSKNGLTPLHLCAQEDWVPVADILVKNGAAIDAMTTEGYTPLHIACHYGQANMVRFLLANGASVKSITSMGYTPLHQAAQQGHTNIVNILLENSAEPNAMTMNEQTPLHIAQKLGYISVIETLKVVTETTTITTTTEEKYRVVAPEGMHETFMSDSEEEGGEDTMLGDHTYRYLTADEMKSLGDDSLPIDVTRDERIDSNKMVISADSNMLPPQTIEESMSPIHLQQNYGEYIKKYTHDNVDIDRHPVNIGFLVSFLVDARGGAMRGCRHSGVHVIVPPRCAQSPTRITCRYVRPQRTPHPPPLMEGEALASRVLELGPVGAKFLGPVIIEIPHFAALRGKEREIVILRSDNGESWKEHNVEAPEEILNNVLHDSFEDDDLNQLEDPSSGRITRIVTQDIPQYFAVVSRVRQEVHAIGPEGGMVSSTVVPQVQAVFPQGALTKKIKVGLQAQPIDPELTAKLLGHGVAVSPVVTVEPRRRKFHKAITLSMPAPRAHSQGMINQYSGSAPTLRLLCSITGGTSRAQWEDVTGSTPLTFVNDCVSFTTTVSARFWLMDCRNIGDATKMATELYREVIHVPFMAKFVVFAKRIDVMDARLRVFCMTDDKEDKTLEQQEHFTEIAKSRDVEVLEGKSQYIEFAGNLVPITKSGEQLQFSFRAFRENRLPFSVRVKDQHAEAVGRALFMREPKVAKGEPPQQPICILNVVLPEDIVSETISLTDTDSLKHTFLKENYDYCRPDPRLADVSNLLGEDWVALANQLGLTTSEINVIKSEYPESVAKQGQSMLRMWISQSGNKAQGNTLENALKRIGREDIIPQCLNVDQGLKRIQKEDHGKGRLKKDVNLDQDFYDREIMRDSESVESISDDKLRKQQSYDKYSAEEKIVLETSEEEEEDFNKSVTERRQQIEKRLSVDRTIPASAQRVEIVQEISSIKRQSLVEDKILEVEQKGKTISKTEKTTLPSETFDEMVSYEPDIAIIKTADTRKEIQPGTDTKVGVNAGRRDSDLVDGVTQILETQKTISKLTGSEDPNSPMFSKTPPPSPADFILRDQGVSIQGWDAAEGNRLTKETTLTQDTSHIGKPTSTLNEPIQVPLDNALDAVVSNESVTVERKNGISESQKGKKQSPSRKSSKENLSKSEAKKHKKGFFGAIKTFVAKSLDSDSESETTSPRSPKKYKKDKKITKDKITDLSSEETPVRPPRKPKLPTPEEKRKFSDIPLIDATSPNKLDSDTSLIDYVREQANEIVSDVITESESTTRKLKDQRKSRKCVKIVAIEDVKKTYKPMAIEEEEFSIIVDPTRKEAGKKDTETFTINIDETIDKIEREIMEKSPILPEESIMKPIVDLNEPLASSRLTHVYAEASMLSLPPDHLVGSILHLDEDIKRLTADLILNEQTFSGWTDFVPDKQSCETTPWENSTIDRKAKKKEKGFFSFLGKKSSKETYESDDDSKQEKIEKQDRELTKEKVDKRHEKKAKKKQESDDDTEEVKKGGFLGLFGKKSKKDEIKESGKPEISQEVQKNMTETSRFLNEEVKKYETGILQMKQPVLVIVPSSTGVEKVDELISAEGNSQQPSNVALVHMKEARDFLKNELLRYDYNVNSKDTSQVIEKDISDEIVNRKVVHQFSEVEKDPQNLSENITESFGISKSEEVSVGIAVEPQHQHAIEKHNSAELLETKTQEGKQTPDTPKSKAKKLKESKEKFTHGDSEERKKGFFELFAKKIKQEDCEKNTLRSELTEEDRSQMRDCAEFLANEARNVWMMQSDSESIVKKAEGTLVENAVLPEKFGENVLKCHSFLAYEIANFEDVRPVNVVKTEQFEEGTGINTTYISSESSKPTVEKGTSAKQNTKVKEEKQREKSSSSDSDDHKKGFFGLFGKRSKKEEFKESKPVPSETSTELLTQMKDCTDFLATEVLNYENGLQPIKSIHTEYKTNINDNVFKTEKTVPEVEKFGTNEINKCEDISPVVAVKLQSADENIILNELIESSTTADEKQNQATPKAKIEHSKPEEEPKKGFLALFGRKTKQEDAKLSRPATTVLLEDAERTMKEYKKTIDTEVRNHEDEAPSTKTEIEIIPEHEKITDLDEMSNQDPKQLDNKNTQDYKKCIQDTHEFITNEVNFQDVVFDTREEETVSSVKERESLKLTDKNLSATTATKAVRKNNQKEKFTSNELEDPKKSFFGLFGKRAKSHTTDIDKTGGRDGQSQIWSGEEADGEKLQNEKPGVALSKKEIVAFTNDFISYEISKYDCGEVPKHITIHCRDTAHDTSTDSKSSLLGALKKKLKISGDEIVAGDSKIIQEEIVEGTSTKVCEEIVKEVKQRRKSGSPFKIFTKRNKSEERDLEHEIRAAPEHIEKQISDTNNFLKCEISGYHDVRPTCINLDTDEFQFIKDVAKQEEHVKSDRLFGLFSKADKNKKMIVDEKNIAPILTKTLSEDIHEPIAVLTDEVLQCIRDTKDFISKEVEVYEDCSNVNYAVEESDELSDSTSKSSGLFSIFAKKDIRQSPSASRKKHKKKKIKKTDAKDSLILKTSKKGGFFSKIGDKVASKFETIPTEAKEVVQESYGGGTQSMQVLQHKFHEIQCEVPRTVPSLEKEVGNLAEQKFNADSTDDVSKEFTVIDAALAAEPTVKEQAQCHNGSTTNRVQSEIKQLETTNESQILQLVDVANTTADTYTQKKRSFAVDFDKFERDILREAESVRSNAAAGIDSKVVDAGRQLSDVFDKEIANIENSLRDSKLAANEKCENFQAPLFIGDTNDKSRHPLESSITEPLDELLEETQQQAVQMKIKLLHTDLFEDAQKKVKETERQISGIVETSEVVDKVDTTTESCSRKSSDIEPELRGTKIHAHESSDTSTAVDAKEEVSSAVVMHDNKSRSQEKSVEPVKGVTCILDPISKKIEVLDIKPGTSEKELLAGLKDSSIVSESESSGEIENINRVGGITDFTVQPSVQTLRTLCTNISKASSDEPASTEKYLGNIEQSIERSEDLSAFVSKGSAEMKGPSTNLPQDVSHQIDPADFVISNVMSKTGATAIEEFSDELKEHFTDLGGQEAKRLLIAVVHDKENVTKHAERAVKTTEGSNDAFVDHISQLSMVANIPNDTSRYLESKSEGGLECLSTVSHEENVSSVSGLLLDPLQSTIDSTMESPIKDITEIVKKLTPDTSASITGLPHEVIIPVERMFVDLKQSSADLQGASNTLFGTVLSTVDNIKDEAAIIPEMSLDASPAKVGSSIESFEKVSVETKEPVKRVVDAISKEGPITTKTSETVPETHACCKESISVDLEASNTDIAPVMDEQEGKEILFDAFVKNLTGTRTDSDLFFETKPLSKDMITDLDDASRSTASEMSQPQELVVEPFETHSLDEKQQADIVKSVVEQTHRIPSKIQDECMVVEGHIFGKMTRTVSDFSGSKTPTAEDRVKISETNIDLSDLPPMESEVRIKQRVFKSDASPYITSPTMQRRSVSQRWPRGERPDLLDVSNMPLDSSSEDDDYIVTEPPDEWKQSDEPAKRKPLFHIASEDDESFDQLDKGRGSFKSNILETLNETLETSASNDEVAKEDEQGAKVDVDIIEKKLRDLDVALGSLESLEAQESDQVTNKKESKLRRIERKFERMASEALDKDAAVVDNLTTPELEAKRDTEFKTLVSQLSVEEISDFQKDYATLWDDQTLSRSEDMESKTPDSQGEIQDLPKGDGSWQSPSASTDVLGATPKRTDGAAGVQDEQGTTAQQRVPDQQELSREMKELLKEMEKGSKQ